MDTWTEFDGIVWEALRFAPITPLLFRRCVVDAVLGQGRSYETKINAGASVLALTQSAMFDSRAIKDTSLARVVGAQPALV